MGNVLPDDAAQPWASGKKRPPDPHCSPSSEACRSEAPHRSRTDTHLPKAIMPERRIGARERFSLFHYVIMLLHNEAD